MPQLSVTATIPVQKTVTANRLDQKVIVELKARRNEQNNSLLTGQIAALVFWTATPALVVTQEGAERHLCRREVRTAPLHSSLHPD